MHIHIIDFRLEKLLDDPQSHSSNLFDVSAEKAEKLEAVANGGGGVKVNGHSDGNGLKVQSGHISYKFWSQTR